MGAETTAIDLWADGQRDLSRLGRSLSATDGELPVPACPRWTVREVFAHQAGVCADVLAGRMEGAPGDEWTARQIAERADVSLGDLLDEWDAAAPRMVEAMRPLGDDVDPRLLADLYTHTHDIRGALGRPGDRGSALADWVVDQMAEWYVALLRREGRAPLTVSFGGGDGDGGPRLVVDRFEFSRARVGRRSPAQIRSWAWEVDDPGPYADLVPFFPPRPDDLVEPA